MSTLEYGLVLLGAGNCGLLPLLSRCYAADDVEMQRTAQITKLDDMDFRMKTQAPYAVCWQATHRRNSYCNGLSRIETCIFMGSGGHHCFTTGWVKDHVSKANSGGKRYIQAAYGI
jgi:hypothetical protein